MRANRAARLALLAALAMGFVFGGFGACIKDNLIQLVGVAALDAFVSPLVGDNCTLWNRSGCDQVQ